MEAIKATTYDNYNDSGVEWLGEIPEHWQIKPGFTILFESKEKNTGFKENTVLSLSYGNVIIKPEEKLTGLVPESFETYQLVEPGDIIIRPTDLQNDKTSLRTGLAKDKGIITSAYINLRILKGYSNKYFHYYLHTIDINKVIYGLGSGLRQNISFEDFKRFPFPFPPLPEQTAIAQFLDDKTTKIDQAIAIKQQQIALLKERKQILIHKAVTCGLNDKVKLKDSGVEWIGEIPEHWEVKRLKNICSINKNALPETTNKDYKLTYVDIGSVTLEEGIVETENFFFKDAPSRARRIAKSGDTVISTVRTYLKAIDFVGVEKSNFIYSTGFAVLEPKKFMHPQFIASFVRSDAFTEQVTVNSKGMSYPAINSTDLSRLFVVHPEKSEQQEIAEYIETASTKIETAIGLKEQEIEKLQEYKSSLINSVVTGKVRVC
ncbi:restriction endonuclease subunit S [Nonlabens sp. SCSIO 43208]|uniref:restriction endonuclease subunit S n=1 Tax=Nonlabens sp. SCSIO 43208 TaxID=2793009 RepID=UPI003D6A0BC7